jgi:type I restriction enzyme S subunit
MIIKQRRSEISPLSLEIPAELPEGWTWTTLGEVCSKITDGTHKTPNYTADGVPFISTANLVPFKVGFDFRQYKRLISQREHDELTRRCHPEKGDVLISKCGTIGRAKEIDVDFPFSIFVGLALLKPYPGLFAPGFLEVWLNAPQLQRTFDDLAPGSTRRTLTLSGLKKAGIPVPPFAEQTRIVAKARELLAHVSATRERLAKVPAILRRFRQAVLAAACSGRLTADWRAQRISENAVSQTDATSHADFPEIPQGWLWLTIDKLSSSLPRSIQSGPFGSNLLHSEFREKGILAIGIDNVLAGKFSTGKQHRISEKKYKELEKYKARPLDVLITVMATVGRCCVVPEDIETAIITKHVYRISPNRELVTPYYLMYSLLGDPTVQSQIQNQIIGQTRPGINGKILKAIAIPTPPISEQAEIVRRVDVLFKLADTIEKRVATGTRMTEGLTRAILSKAFLGELVPTEAELARRESRSYELACELLGRIKATNNSSRSKMVQQETTFLPSG